MMKNEFEEMIGGSVTDEEHIRLIDKTRAGLVDKLKRLKMGNEDS